MTFRQKLMGGIALYALTAALPAHATIFAGHSGSTGSNPSGTNLYPFIALDCPTNTAGTSTCTKTYTDNLPSGAFHSMSAAGSAVGGLLSFTETIVNNTNRSWSDYHFVFQGASAFGEQFASNLPAGVSYTQQFNANSWDIFFQGGTIDPGEQFTAFVFLQGITEGSISQAPSLVPVREEVPEPGSLALMGAGLAGLATLRRRRRAEA